jgi:haloalkane dehalogenase
MVDPGDEVAAAYDAPFPSEASKAGARAFPQLIPLAPDDPGATVGRDVLTALRSDAREVLLLWGAEDRPLPVAAGERFASELGVAAPRLIEGAGHFLQEDRGAEIGAIIADWLG